MILANPKVDAFLKKSKPWRDEMTKLREIVRTCPLVEELKWGKPCYTFQDKNVVLIHGFKDYCALLFIKGALLKDPKGILIQQTENVQAARQARFTDIEQIEALEPVLTAYIRQAIEIEKAGLKVEQKETKEYAVPEELKIKFKEISGLKKAFESLTPGRQRGYLLFFAAAKQAKTREARVEKYVRQILAGKGLND